MTDIGMTLELPQEFEKVLDKQRHVGRFVREANEHRSNRYSISCTAIRRRCR